MHTANPPILVKKQLLSLLIAGASGFALGIHPADAADYAGNGNNGFGGNVGGGTLSVNNNSSGGFILSFTLAGNATTFNGAANDLVIYIDNGTGGGIGSSTAALNDTGDNSRIPVSEYDGTNRSILSFGTLMSPQFGIDLSSGQANIFGLTNNSGAFGFTYGGGSAVNNTNSGVSYALNGSTYSLTLPATAIGLTAFSGATLKFVAINVSNTGFSSNEATVGLSGNSGYANTQMITGTNSFTSAVPEPGTWAMIALGVGGLIAVQRRRSVAS